MFTKSTKRILFILLIISLFLIPVISAETLIGNLSSIPRTVSTSESFAYNGGGGSNKN